MAPLPRTLSQSQILFVEQHTSCPPSPSTTPSKREPANEAENVSTDTTPSQKKCEDVMQRIILKTAVGSGKVMQDFDSELIPAEGHIPQAVKGSSAGREVSQCFSYRPFANNNPVAWMHKHLSNPENAANPDELARLCDLFIDKYSQNLHSCSSQEQLNTSQYGDALRSAQNETEQEWRNS